jgi:hypothetical protein
MGYRLYASIPNIMPYEKDLELGKQYDSKWEAFNDKWFGEGNDSGFISHEDIEEFYTEYVEINNQPGDCGLYNTQRLKSMVDYALLNKLDIYFVSY